MRVRRRCLEEAPLGAILWMPPCQSIYIISYQYHITESPAYLPRPRDRQTPIKTLIKQTVWLWPLRVRHRALAEALEVISIDHVQLLRPRSPPICQGLAAPLLERLEVVAEGT